MKKFFILAGLLGILALTGCTNKNIAAVKAMALPGSSTLTIGQALDHRKACDSVTWKELTSAQQQKVVEYTCSLGGMAAWNHGDNPVVNKTEIMQWTVGPDGQPVFSYLGWKRTWKDGKTNLIDAVSLTRSQLIVDATFRVIAENRVTNVMEYGNAVDSYYKSAFYGAALDSVRARGNY